MSSTSTSRQTAFHARLAALTDQWMDLFGYLAPSVVTTTAGEYRACREAAALMDFSMLRKIDIEGPGAAEMMNGLVTRDLSLHLPRGMRGLRPRLAKLVLSRERKLAQVGEADEAVPDACLSPLACVEPGRLADAPELPLPCAGRQPPRLLPRRRLDLALPDPVTLALVLAQPARGR